MVRAFVQLTPVATMFATPAGFTSPQRLADVADAVGRPTALNAIVSTMAALAIRPTSTTATNSKPSRTPHLARSSHTPRCGAAAALPDPSGRRADHLFGCARLPC